MKNSIIKRISIVLSLALIITSMPVYATEVTVSTETTAEKVTEEQTEIIVEDAEETVEESEEIVIEIVDDIIEEPETSEDFEDTLDEEKLLEENDEEEQLEEIEEASPADLVYREIIGEPCAEVIVKGMLPESVKVHAVKLTYEDVKEYVENEEDFKGAYDVTLLFDGEEYQPEEPVSVEFKEVDDLDNVEVTHVHDEGTEDEEVTTIEVNESEDGNAEIEVDGFSVMILTGGSGTDYSKCLTFTAVDAGATVSFRFASGCASYSTCSNGSGSWSDWKSIKKDTTGTGYLVLAQGDSIRFIGTDIKTDNTNHFDISSGRIAASGDVTSLTNGIGDDVSLSEDCYKCMFIDCTGLVVAPNLPSKTLATGSYSQMFTNCSNLKSAPSLQAMTLAPDCYKQMFQGCTGLISAPKLPAKKLANNCYFLMFSGCTSLTEAPELWAETMEECCYKEMFYGCTSLTEAPTLPAKSLAKSCYSEMFSQCISLTKAPSLDATVLAPACYSNMFYQCISLTKAPPLSAMTLADYCCQGMFESCTSLTETPVLPATNLADGCYYCMFYGCTGLKKAPSLKATVLKSNCYYGMFAECTGLELTTDSNSGKGELLNCTLNGFSQTTLSSCASYMFYEMVIDGSLATDSGTPQEGNIYYCDIVVAEEDGEPEITYRTTSFRTTSFPASRWETTKDGKWKYRKSNGQFAKDEWQRVFYNGAYHWYHFGSDTLMDTGWLLDKDGSWYFLERVEGQNIGIMQTGWMTDPYDGYKYYLDPVTGKMATGKTVIDGKTYYFNEIVPEASGWTQNASEDWVYEKRKVIPLGALISN